MKIVMVSKTTGIKGRMVCFAVMTGLDDASEVDWTDGMYELAKYQDKRTTSYCSSRSK